MENSNPIKPNVATTNLQGVPFYDFIERNIRWLRWVFVLLIYLVAVGFGFLNTQMDPLYVTGGAFMVLAVLSVMAIYQRIDMIPVLVLATALFVPFSLPTGSGSKLAPSMAVVVVFFGLWVIYEMSIEKRFKIQKSPVNFPIVAFMVVTLFSVFWSILFRDPFVFVWEKFTLAQIIASLTIVFLPVAFLMVANFINTTRPLKIMVFMMIIAGAPGLVRSVTGFELPVNIKGMFSLWVIALSFAFAIFEKKLHWILRLALLGLVGAFVYWNFIKNITWVAGWLPALIALGILTWMRSKKMAILFMVFALVLFLANKEYYLGKVLKQEEQESGYTRLAAWKMNWLITRDHLLFGTGAAGYAVYYMTYFPANAMATHNNYIDILAQTGIVGSIFNLWFFAAVVVVGYKLCRRLKGRGDFMEGLANAAFAGTCACIVIMAFGDWLYPFAYTQTIEGYNHAVYNWLFMGTIIVLDRLAPTKVETTNA